MIASFALILICSFVFLGFWLASLALRVDMRRLEQLEKYSEKYKSAMNNILARNVDFPTAVLNELYYWNKAVSEKNYSRNVALMLLRLIIDKKMRNIKLENIDRERDIFFLEYPDIEIEYVKMSLYAIIMSSYRAPLWGLITRSVAVELFDDKSPKEVKKFTESVRRQVRVSSQSNSRDLDGAVPSAA